MVDELAARPPHEGSEGASARLARAAAERILDGAIAVPIPNRLLDYVGAGTSRRALKVERYAGWL